MALVAEGAFLVVDGHAEEAALVEQPPERAERTDGPAEGPLADDEPAQEDGEKPELPVVHEPDEGAEVRLEEDEGDAGLERPGRADPFAEPGLPVAELVDDEKGQGDDHRHEDHVAEIGHEVGDAELGRPGSCR